MEQGEGIICMTYHYWLLTFVKHNVLKTDNVYSWVIPVGSSEMFVTFYQTAHSQLPEDNGPHVYIMNSLNSVSYLKLIKFHTTKTSGLWCSVPLQININVSEEPSASIFRMISLATVLAAFPCKKTYIYFQLISASTLINVIHLEDGGNKFHRNVGTNMLSYRV